MKINTKYDVGDRVRFKNPDYDRTSIKTGKVLRIEIEVEEDNSVKVCYVLWSMGRHKRMDEWFVPDAYIKEKVK